MKNLSLVLVSLLILFVFPTITFAKETKGITVSPAYIDITLDHASEEKSFSVTFFNNTNDDVSLEIFPVDFKQQDSLGTLGFLNQQAGSYSYSLSSFLTFDTSSLEIGKHQEAILHVTVTNRPDLSPGGHYAAVVGRLKHEKGDTQVAPAVTSLVLLRKTGGERYNLSLKTIDFSKNILQFVYPTSISLLFQNEGNVHVTPFGRIEITDMLGRLLYKGILNSASAKVFPESLRYISVDMTRLRQSFPISFNTVTINGQDSLRKTTFLYRGSYLYIHPIIVIVICVVIVLIILKKLKRKKKNKES